MPISSQSIPYYSSGILKMDSSAGVNVLQLGGAGNNIGLAANNFAQGVTGTNNFAAGFYAMGFAVVSGSYNQAIGFEAGVNFSSTSFQVAIGGYSLAAISSSAYQHVGIGWQALMALTNAALPNLAIGHGAGKKITDGGSNIILGYGALTNSLHAGLCVAIGKDALGSYADGDTSGYNCNSIAIGVATLYNNTTGYENVAIGTSTLGVCTSGTWNTGCGIQAMQSLTTGNYCSAFGLSALNLVTTGSGNTGVGQNAGVAFMGTPSTTIAGLGQSGAGANTTGNWNTYLGSFTSNLTATQRNWQTIIGCNAQGVDRDASVTLGRIGTDVVFAGLAMIGLKDATGAIYTVAQLPAASAALKAARTQVSDAMAPTFMGAASGGGSTLAPVMCNGSAWIYA